MKESHTDSKLSKYNKIMKENEDFYRDAARASGLSESVFWILYTLRTGHATVQSEICACMYQPKQTVNSSLKKLEADGYIRMSSKEDRRSKQISLTAKGVGLCETTVDKIIQVECDALDRLSEEELEQFLSLFRKFMDLLNKGAKRN